ncbi:MAG: protein-L-isoaspartate O-methyltransferase, partial [Novosphingobium sp.]|nr:protein-L-isoaspartate O-methyltransferase [Novosphingobium sp.]
EVGAGSGYAAAVMAEIGAEVFAIERHAALVNSAREKLQALGYTAVHLRCGDGSTGWPEEAPFDAVLVAAAGPHIPDSLKRQLAIGGRLIMPLGRHQQYLVRITRKGAEDWHQEDLCAVAFVPLIGKEGWSEANGD